MVEEKSSELFGKVKKDLPKGCNISDIRFEGCEVVLYTKNKDFFAEPKDSIKKIVLNLKKRIILRPDPSICINAEEAKEKVEKIIPKDAGLNEIIFEPEFGQVTIEVKKPGLAIGKGGEILRKIRKETSWLPVIKRAPAIPTKIVDTLRKLIYKESAFRKDFLNKIGKNIHSGWKKTEWIRLTTLGAFREVGRSAILIQTPESRVLLDCGIKPGSLSGYPYLNVPEFDISKLNAIVVSHAHMDHSCLVPFLYKLGYKGPLYCTYPTRDLMVLLWLDFMNLSQREGGDPLYSSKDIEEAVKRCVCLKYNEVSDITPDVRLTLLNSGHILGGALTHLHIGNGLHNILYTSDFKFDRTALFEPASLNFTRAETVITESTYGSKKDIMPQRSQSESMLVEAVKKTIERGGIALIPAFAVERSQDIQVILEQGGIKCPIYIDGMIWDATAITTTYPEFLNRNLQRLILQKGENPFTSEIFKRVGSESERKKILKKNEPCVIIATSGMLIGGPSVWWFKQIAGDKKNMMVFVGYQGEGTLGRKIQKGWGEVPMEEKGKTKAVPVQCEVITIEGLSGHSDRKQILNYISRLKQRPERILVGHGEASKCKELASDLHKIFKVETMAPKLLETIRLK